MALHRKVDVLLALEPDIAVVSECADPDRLRRNGTNLGRDGRCVWVGTNPTKGLGVFALNDFRVELAEPYVPTLKHIAPVTVSGPHGVNLLAVWAQNASGGITRKNQLGPLRRALTKYRTFLTARPALIGGDLNNNAIWDRPGWRMNHMTTVRILREMGLVSAYHELTGEAHGEETVPTHYWRDRRKDGPTYHIDYVFVAKRCIEHVQHFEVGSFEDWCGNGLSDHVPIVIELTST